MNKRYLVLVLGLLAVIMISNVEDYISSPEFSFGEQDNDTIDYYLTDFSLQALTSDGKVSHTMAGDYLAHWQQRGSSFIIKPRLVSKDDSHQNNSAAPTAQPVDAITLEAEEALLDHETNTAELGGKVRLVLAGADGEQLTLDTAQLNYQIDKKHISTTENVSINSPHIQLSGTGLDSQLDESYLRLNANVKSIYQPR